MKMHKTIPPCSLLLQGGMATPGGNKHNQLHIKLVSDAYIILSPGNHLRYKFFSNNYFSELPASTDMISIPSDMISEEILGYFLFTSRLYKTKISKIPLSSLKLRG